MKLFLTKRTETWVNVLHSLQKAYATGNNPLSPSRLATFYATVGRNLASTAKLISLGYSLYRLGKFGIDHKAMLLRNKTHLLIVVGNTFFSEWVLILLRRGKQRDSRDTYKLLYEAFDVSVGEVVLKSIYFFLAT